MRTTQIVRAAPATTGALTRQLAGGQAVALTSMTIERPITSFPAPWQYARPHISWAGATVTSLGDGATKLPADEHGITINTGLGSAIIRYAMWARLGADGAVWAMGYDAPGRVQYYDAYVRVPPIGRLDYYGNWLDEVAGGVGRHESVWDVRDGWVWQMGTWPVEYVWSAGLAVELIGAIEVPQE